MISLLFNVYKSEDCNNGKQVTDVTVRYYF